MNVIEAIYKFKGEWPSCNETDDGWYINQVGELSFNGYQVSRFDEFDKFVQELSTNFGRSVTYEEYKVRGLELGCIHLANKWLA